ncbi:hypothetical protein [Streptomyces sp. NPDC094437]|uniref:hypothetical protein n=1 Tax=Streptomyces sp. NPDC094437 TaxID=3366060 RepID=UPI003800387D
MTAVRVSPPPMPPPPRLPTRARAEARTRTGLSPMLTRLAAEHATGVLVRAHGTLHLADGLVVHAESPAAPGLDVLLPAHAALGADDWAHVLAEAGGDAHRAGRHLVATGRLTPGALEICRLTALHDAAYFTLAPSSTPGRFRYGTASGGRGEGGDRGGSGGGHGEGRDLSAGAGAVVGVGAEAGVGAGVGVEVGATVGTGARLGSGVGVGVGVGRPLTVAVVERETIRRRALLHRIWPDPRPDDAPLTVARRPAAPALTRRQRAVVARVDGVRTATDIARDLGRLAFPTLVDVRRLTAAGVLDPGPPRTGTPAPAPPARGAGLRHEDVVPEPPPHPDPRSYPELLSSDPHITLLKRLRDALEAL